MVLLKPFHPLLLKRLFPLVIAFFAFQSISWAQERCGTVEYTNKLLAKKLLRENDSQFEKWLVEKQKKRAKQNLDQGRTQTTFYQVPIVVHVIHNGEAIGNGTNISDAQVLSQIDVLNNDFKRLNADASNTPAEFLPFAGSMDIEFVLAKQNPAGNPTTGIVRVQGTKTLWTINDDVQLKATSYWPAEDYFNIWICNMSAYLGYTQFPVSTLPGLEDSPNNRLTDGIVIGYQYFGTKDAGLFNLQSRYDKGRTATHEVGHFFGLRHIWGDVSSDCSGTDYINDTPSQKGSTGGCSSGPLSNGCAPTSAHKMYQNYLDYTDDACMNIFTVKQVERMSTVIENSPRRASLLTSHGLIDPSLVANDLGIRKILSPLIDECTHFITPSIEIKNQGNNMITSANIQLEINYVIAETINFPLNLNVGESTTVSFTTLNNNQGNFSYSFKILQTNGVIDGGALNNISTINTLISDRISTPFEENFTSIPFNWQVQNQDQLNTWVIQTAPLYNAGNTAAEMDYFTYENEGAIDVLITPPFDLTNETLAFFLFDVAHARFKNKVDGLKVFILTNCNTDITMGTEVYYKSGDDLATTIPTSVAFKPKGESEWRKEAIDLGPYLGQNNLRMAFVGINGYGNNLYIDNVSMITSLDIDLAIANISNPSIVSCNDPSPKLLVQNVGSADITSFNIEYKVNAGDIVTVPVVVSELSLDTKLKSGDTLKVTLPTIDLQDGVNTVSFNVTNPNNGGTDINLLNNQKTTKVIADQSEITIPFRENFNNGLSSGWIAVNQADGMKWDIDYTNYRNSAYFNSFNDLIIGDEAWLVSPLLDFSHAKEASMYFDHSYALRNGSVALSEQLRILASIGCGNAFDSTLYDNSGNDLSNTVSSTNWKPYDEGDWKREAVNLSSLAGKKDVRLAFVVTNGNGNNLYLDNLEFYASTTPDTTKIPNYFAISRKPNDKNIGVDFHIKFKLPEQETVDLEIIDMMGRSVLYTQLDYILNQDYPVVLENAATGVYIVRVHTNNKYYAQRVLIQK